MRPFDLAEMIEAQRAKAPKRHPEYINAFKPGEVVNHIVGMPGPDIDDATIVARNPDGTYQIKFQVYGQGEWHQGAGFPNERRIGGIFRREIRS